MRVLELCFDGSGVSIRNHDIFAAYTPTGFRGVAHEGVGIPPRAYCAHEGLATYLPPVRVPELAWRARDPDEDLTVADRELWETRGWKTRPGVRAYQAARTLHHVLASMLETDVKEFIAPKVLEEDVSW